MPLTVRGSALRHHTGQVSLPGGRLDAGETVEQAALREAQGGTMPLRRRSTLSDTAQIDPAQAPRTA